MTKLNAGWKGWLAAATVAGLLAACGTSSRPTVSGVAQAGGPVVGRVSVIDSSATPVRRTGTTGADGAFVVDATGMTPPFLVRVEGTSAAGATRLFSATEDGHRGDVNPLTSAAFSGASGSGDSDDEDAFEGRHGDRRDTARGAVRLLQQLQQVLAPLLTRYGITDPTVDRAAVRLLLADVKFEVSHGTIKVTNRATGAVIFTGPLNDLASGTFDASAMPPGPGTPPPPTTGEGATLYEVNCASCHGALAQSQVRGESVGDIQEAIRENEGGMGVLSNLTLTQLQAIAAALNGSGSGGGGTPGTCTYTYSAWGTCTNGSQTRTVVTATPAGCTGTPVLTQACGTAIDGAALYSTYCAGCHGNGKKGSSAASIQAAINANTGGMGSAALRALTPEQIAAIAAAP